MAEQSYIRTNKLTDCRLSIIKLIIVFTNKQQLNINAQVKSYRVTGNNFDSLATSILLVVILRKKKRKKIGVKDEFIKYNIDSGSVGDSAIILQKKYEF